MVDGRIVVVYEDYYEALRRISEKRHLLRITFKGDVKALRVALSGIVEKFSMLSSKCGINVLEIVVAEDWIKEVENALLKHEVVTGLSDDPLTPLLKALTKGSGRAA